MVVLGRPSTAQRRPGRTGQGVRTHEGGSESCLDDTEEQAAAIFWCAPSFEEFAHRFWIENRLWHAVNGGDPSRLEPQLCDYLLHYTPPESSACP